MNAILTIFGKSYKVTIETFTYKNKTLAVEAIDTDFGGPFAVLSTNIPGVSEHLPKGAFYAKHWSENEGFPEQLVEQGIFIPVDAPIASSGFVTGIRAYKLNSA